MAVLPEIKKNLLFWKVRVRFLVVFSPLSSKAQKEGDSKSAIINILHYLSDIGTEVHLWNMEKIF
jgi:hypothetical protein